MCKMLSQVDQGHVTENTLKIASHARLPWKQYGQYGAGT